MPLTDAVPVIDNRRYDDIYEEIKSRIALYTPEWKPVWNDYNDSDPGITLAQLMSWLSDMMLYRLAKVPDLNYVSFLEMLGIELQEALPAVAAVTFPVDPGFTLPYVDVPLGTQVSAVADDGGPPLIFETDTNLRALTARLLSVQAFDGTMHTDVTPANAAATPFQPFGSLPPVGAALVLGFGYPAGYPSPDSFPQTALDLSLYATGDSATSLVVSCGGGLGSAFSPARLQWECWTGSDWRRMDTLRDNTLAMTRTGLITVRTPADGTMQRDWMGAYVNDGTQPPLFWTRGRLVTSQFATAPLLAALRTNTVTVTQAQTVLGEVLGGSNGTRNQSWTLANSPVLRSSVQVQIDDGTGPQTWTVKKDLLSSRPRSLDLQLAPTSGVLTAGDGINGAIPVANAQNPDANVVAVRYRYGGTSRGNVAAAAIKTLVSSVPGIDDGNVANLFAAVGGTDEESLSNAKERARRQIRSNDRAVTVEDFEALAKQAGGVARAKALPLYHPQFPAIPVPGVVSVIVVPMATPIVGLPFKPTPSDGLLRLVCAYLDARRLLTTELYLLAPTYQEIVVTTVVVPTTDADSSLVWAAVEAALVGYFDPLVGGDVGTGWGFGDTIRYSKVYQRIFSVDGVDAIETLTITVDGIDYPACQDVPIKVNGLLYSGAHDVQVALSTAEAAA